MDIRIYSFGTPESAALRTILEGMYRRVGRVDRVGFPDDNSIILSVETSMDLEFEYGLHKMIRIPPRSESGEPDSSFVMVEIDGKTRDEIVATYTFYPFPIAENFLNGRTADPFVVLGGNPLGQKMKMKMRNLETSYA